MKPTICIACGERMTRPTAENPNVCAPCTEETAAPEPPITPENRARQDSVDRSHAPRRRTPAIGDHSHQRNPPSHVPKLPRSKAH